MVNGIGYGLNVACCTFPDDLDPDDKPFEGVMFSIFEDELILDYQTLYKYLKQASEVYLKENKGDEIVIEKILNAFRKNHQLE